MKLNFYSFQTSGKKGQLPSPGFQNSFQLSYDSPQNLYEWNVDIQAEYA